MSQRSILSRPSRLLILLISTVHLFLVGMSRPSALAQSMPEPEEMIRTLIASQNIPKGTLLDESMVKRIDVPRKWRQPGALASVEDVLGQLTAVPIQKDGQILITQLLSPKNESLTYQIGKRMRAVVVPINDVSLLCLVKPHMRVDILATFRDKLSKEFTTITLFQNVVVLAVGDNYGQVIPQNMTDASATIPEAGCHQAESSSQALIVALSPEDAQKLALAAAAGELTVTVRSVWEMVPSVELAPVTFTDLLPARNEGLVPQ